MRRAIQIFILLFLVGSILSVFGKNQEIPYSVPQKPWPEKYGSQRAVFIIEKHCEAARINFLWRRHDTDPDKKRMIIMSSEDTIEIQNIYRVQLNSEKCELVFGPVVKPGKYFLYYLPYEVQEGWGWFSKDYLKPENPPDNAWLQKNIKGKNYKNILNANIQEIQSRTAFDSFYPMEVIATKEEKSAFLMKYNSGYLVFPEDRKYPIRMTDELPYRWLKKTPGEKFSGTALKNEYYAFQLGVFAIQKELKDLKISFSDLKNKNGDLIPENLLTCFNSGGIDPYGRPFSKTINIPKDKIQALWIGVDVQKDVSPGVYEGLITLEAENSDAQKIKIEITVEDKIIADRGDGETWRHSRLRWLNSTLGIDDENVAPYNPLNVNGNEIEATGKKLFLDNAGIPSVIFSAQKVITSSNLKFIIETENGNLDLKAEKFEITSRKSGVVSWVSKASHSDIQLTCHGTMESDGYINYFFKILPLKDIKIKDIRLEIPFKKEAAKYIMGMGLPGSSIPEKHQSKWEGPHDSFWIGDTKGGLYCELRGASYMGPLLNLYKPDPPESWNNSGRGGFKIISKDSTVSAVAYSGERNLLIGRELDFKFSLIITPVKKLNPFDQFTQRYYHFSAIPNEEDLKRGIKIINLHHANKYNPYINYPFIAQKELKEFVDSAHNKALKLKIYYTIRELTNYVTEIWALRSLGDEMLAFGKGGGFPWLREHLIENYTWQWYQHYDDQGSDAALLTSGISRWFNYYIEGLSWLVKNMNIDGLYLDDVSFDRRILKRMRKVMERVKPGCLIDLHSNTLFSIGPVTQYMEFFPYIDKLWFGEGFQYDKMSQENWLVEVSGIPFGLMGDMLQGGGNPWRGVLYGMTVRYPWFSDGVNCDPRAIWKVWDDFGIQDSKMIGYWEKEVPVKTGDGNILATVYAKKDKILIALASWAEKDTNVKLNIDWKSIGMSSVNKTLYAPFIENFQEKNNYSIDGEIPVRKGKGLILIIEN